MASNTADNLPISVIVPHLRSRDKFFYDYCLPSIEANYPAEVFIFAGPESNQAKRNQGARIASQPFYFFCDDDVIMPRDFLKRLHAAIDGFDFAYCDYIAANHPTPSFKRHVARPFDYHALRKGNYISTMSLVRAAVFPGFDEKLTRLQDWDLWLTMAKAGCKGIYVEDLDFIAFYLDDGITNNRPHNGAHIVRRKHNI